MQFYLHELCLCIFVFLPYAICKLEQIDFPDRLARCYNDYYKKTSIAKSVGYQVHFRCYQDYRLKTSTSRRYKGKLFGLKNNGYISKVMEGVKTNSRGKRQAGGAQGGGQKRYRKEFRMMTDQERKTYLNAIQTLKTTTVSINSIF